MAFGLDSIDWESKEKTATYDCLKVSTHLEPNDYAVRFELHVADNAIDVSWELSDNGSHWGVFDRGRKTYENRDSAYVYMIDTLNQLAQTYADWDYIPLRFRIPYKETAC